jgi:hypothetical protein
MWLNIKWYDVPNPISDVTIPIREDGAYGPLLPDGQFFEYTDVNGVTHQFNPESILDLAGTNTNIYEVHPAITQEWAVTLKNIGHTDTPIGFNRLTGLTEGTIGQLADGLLGQYAKSFHFVLNNYIADDNRIPPYRMSYDEALKRNALPVPDDQYGGTPGGVYNHWDEKPLNPPAGAVYADITLYYQGTSWEYVQFLWLANKGIDPAQGGNVFLGEEGVNYLDAWVNADSSYGALGRMVPPYPMATTTWVKKDGCTPLPEICDDGVDNDCDAAIDCVDPDCDADPVCDPGNLIEFPFCFDGLDNDGDGLFDCEDRADCDNVSDTSTCGVGVCATTGSQTCNNGTLNDTCTPGDPTEPGMEMTCGDGLDNDCDGLTDASDPDCSVAAACSTYADNGSCNMDPSCEWVGNPKSGSCQDAPQCTPAPEICDNGIDDDCDGMADCADTVDCGADPVCQCTPEPEICNDGIDNDCDGAVDGTDPDCVMNCSQWGDRTSCRDNGCKWDNKAGMCINP